jgi:hypothetical protein
MSRPIEVTQADREKSERVFALAFAVTMRERSPVWTEATIERVAEAIAEAREAGRKEELAAVLAYIDRNQSARAWEFRGAFMHGDHLKEKNDGKEATSS